MLIFTYYIASLNPRTLYVRTELSHNNESYVVPDLKGVTLQQHYDAIKDMVKQKTGRAMQHQYQKALDAERNHHTQQLAEKDKQIGDL